MLKLLALLADWANGLLAVLTAAYFTETEVFWWHFLIGILFSHTPDLDALSELFKTGKIGAHSEQGIDHREGLHYPVLWILFGIVATYVFGYFGLVFLIAITLHFINDLYGTGWGIKLFWPISKRNYKLFGRRVNKLKVLLNKNNEWNQLTHDERKLRIIVSWSPEELPIYIKKWGIDNWIELYYFRLNWISGIEYILFILALFLAIKSLLY